MARETSSTGIKIRICQKKSGTAGDPEDDQGKENLVKRELGRLGGRQGSYRQ
jgi:hypothetical protein